MDFKLALSINEPVTLSLDHGVELYIKREDQVHPAISGNKFRKLKYNLEAAKTQGQKTLLTFGGAYSNHVAAVASAGNEFGFRTVGVIRGEELIERIESNPTLKLARDLGMRFKFVSRETYRGKTSKGFLERLQSEFGTFYLLPEGGTNALAIKGCEEILTPLDVGFDFICCPVGSGGTISGLINCSKPGQQILGFSALKGQFLKEDIGKFVRKNNWRLLTDYHFGGYAKINEALIGFINTFKSRHGIPLDPIYTGKMMFGVFDLLNRGYFPKGSRILAIHTGGLQGIEPMNIKLKTKGLPLIH